MIASQGYPGTYEKGKKIEIGQVPLGRCAMGHHLRDDIDPLPTLDTVVFHAGTTVSGNDVVTSGGRVIAVSAYATTLQEALNAAYAGVDQVHFENKVFRRDIAHR